ncbi:MAG: hypothetical protein J6S21_03485 [Victivallales bacterium]|jgi:hypothetical protein|nr:hypothetical protein [Victivallales bacterium]
MKVNRMLIFALPLLLFFCGCSTWENYRYTPVYVISLHEFESQRVTSDLVTAVTDRDHSNPRSVKRFPFLDSRSFPSGEVTGPDENGRYGIRLFASRWSVGTMQQTASSNYGAYFAVVIDGMYAGASRFNREMCNSMVCELDKLWNRREAERIVEHIERNYRKNNDWWNK